MERRLTAGAPKREDTTTERLMAGNLSSALSTSPSGGMSGGYAVFIFKKSVMHRLVENVCHAV